MVHGLRWSAGVGAALAVRVPSRMGVVESESEGAGDGRKVVGRECERSSSAEGWGSVTTWRSTWSLPSAEFRSASQFWSLLSSSLSFNINIFIGGGNVNRICITFQERITSEWHAYNCVKYIIKDVY